MEEADAIATRVAIISSRLLSVGTTQFLRQKYGNMYHIHLILKSAPRSTHDEIQAVEKWIRQQFFGACLYPLGNYHGQVRFSIPANSSLEDDQYHDHTESTEKAEDRITIMVQPETNIVRTLFTLLETNKDTMGISDYSIAATTLDEVFLNILCENNASQGSQ
jgi:hypothetical protein